MGPPGEAYIRAPRLLTPPVPLGSMPVGLAPSGDRREMAEEPSDRERSGLGEALARSRRRRVALAALVAILAGAATGALWWARAGHVRAPLQGAVLTPPVTAYDFRLPDPDGRLVSLGSLRGKVVVLTFLYTHCPDVCPLIADTLHRAYGMLGPTARETAFVAVSVDPRGDTPDAIREFLHRHRLVGELIFLRGSLAQLRPVWAHYYVGTDAKEVTPQAVAVSRPAPDQVAHTAIVYVIDPQGKIRVFLPSNFDPKDLVTDVQALVRAR